MLCDLHIKNLAVLEEATIELGPGFNVLSGETGAGKSIVVDSLALLSGVRASADLIRTGADVLEVTGFFEPAGEAWRRPLAKAGIDTEEGELIIRREVSRSGKNRVYVNDRPVTLKLLAEIAPLLLRIHGQREELGLVAPELQRRWLDRSGGAEAAKRLGRVEEAYRAYRTLAERLAALTGDDRARQERLDLLRFQNGEIEAAGLGEGEEDELRREREVLRHSEAIAEALGLAADLLFERENTAWEAIGRARHHLEQIGGWEPQAAAWAAELEEIHVRLGDLESSLGRRRGEVEADPRRLNAIEDRLAVLERLLRKYGESTKEVLAYQRAIVAELAELEGDESTLTALEKEVAAALDTYREAAADLSSRRRSWADRLVKRVHKDLKDLALDKARFAVELGRRKKSSSPLLVAGEPVDFNELGYDQVVYLFSPNPGEELRPLGKVASGGELSRLYLAVQLASREVTRSPGVSSPGVSSPGIASRGVASRGVASRGVASRGVASRGVASRGVKITASASTLVFDEVDVGVGGAEAASLGAKLRRLAQGGQILAVTHLPQVASCADVHFKVKKMVRKGRTHTSVERLAAAEHRVEEVARMLAGSEVTELSLSHARELIASGAG